MSALVRVLCLAAVPIAWAQTPAVTLVARMQANGEVIVRVTSSQEGIQAAPILAEVVHCQGKMISVEEMFGNFRCSKKLRRDGLSLEAVFDLAPIAQRLAATDEIQLWLEYPRLGFEESSVPLNDEGARLRLDQTARFSAGDTPEPIRIQFGYRLDQLPVIYLPLAAMALALMLIAMSLSSAGLAHLNSSVFLLGTIFWLGPASWLQAGDPLRILLSATPLANVAGVLMEYCPPLLCVAAGAALGSRREDRRPGEIFAEAVWGLGIFLFPMTCVLGAVTSMTEGDWIGLAPWLVAGALSVVVCRWRILAGAGTIVRQLGECELKDRVSQLAEKAGRHNVQVCVSSSMRSQVSNAFALRNGILLTAPLVQSLTKREVDAVVAHELSHFGHVRHSPWSALAVAVALSQTPLTGLFLPAAGGLAVVVLLPLVVFFAALYAARRREFAADAGSAALTGDPRAMIGALARIGRNNSKPLDFSAVVEWFSTHPSTRKRIRALARAGRMEAAEVETLCVSDDPGQRYSLPPEDDAIFTLAWQEANAARYTWSVLLGASGAGLLVAWLLEEFAGAGVPQLAGGIVLGCALTKALASAVMSGNYARLRRKLAQKLEAGGQLVGLAVDREPRVYNGFRFSDAGFLSFEGGRLCYRSERTTIELHSADVVEVGMVAAAPSSWRRSQPIVRFRHGASSEVHAFILHPVEWGATPRRLLQSIERWRATATSAEATSIGGFSAVAGQPFRVPTIAETARAFQIPGTVTLVGAVFAGWFFRTESWPAWYALAVTACAYTFMFLPALLYRPRSLPPVLTPRIGAE